MEEKFPGYRKLQEEDFSRLWNECIFVFDTNVLLNLYRYKTSTRNELLRIFDKIKDRLWIPHQVALEYHDERLNVIKSLMAAYDKLAKLEKENYAKIKNELENYKERHPIIDVEMITAVLESNYKSISEELEKEKGSHPDWASKDDIKDKIYSLFERKVGESYAQESLEEIYRRGEIRYSLKIPPGYKDKNEKPDFPYKEYGDLVLWFQLIDESKRVNKHIIFITDDTKKDWFIERSSPRPELIQEFFSETGKMLYIYSPKDFMKWSQNYLKITVAETAIKEIEDVKRGDEKFFRDWPNKSIIIRTELFDDFSSSEEDRIDELSQRILEEVYKKPDMTEEEANSFALDFLGDIAKKGNLKIIFDNKDRRQEYLFKKGRIGVVREETIYI